jgi:MoxR-like ATPase
MSKFEQIRKALKKLDVPYEHELPLPQVDSWPETVHMFDKEQIWALRAALAAERPLLVRGEPGTGKSQLARAAAALLGRAFINTVIFSGSECHELQYHFDEVTRLGKAQILSTLKEVGDVEEKLEPRHFLSPGVLWWAFDWNGANAQYDHYASYSRIPHQPKGWHPSDGAVLLIDEIDKAEAELPNGLLETLGNGSFTIPYLKQAIGLSEDSPPPLVVITTNEERELPDAFVRRCLVLHLSVPEEDESLKKWLIKRGRIHFKEQCGDDVLNSAAEMLIEDRKSVLLDHRVGPGLAEYLDMLRAMTQIPGDQMETLNAIRTFVLKKHTREQE